jgi:hypothetical protein
MDPERGIIGSHKGWCVTKNSRALKNGKKSVFYSAFVSGVEGGTVQRKAVYVKSCADKRIAISLAISAANRMGKLNWEQTMRYAKKHDLDISYDDVIYGDWSGSSFHKGWYVERNKYGWQVRIGIGHNYARYLTSAATFRSAIIIAIKTAIAEGTYNEAASMKWLDEKGMMRIMQSEFMKRKKKEAV